MPGSDEAVRSGRLTRASPIYESVSKTAFTTPRAVERRERIFARKSAGEPSVRGPRCCWGKRNHDLIEHHHLRTCGRPHLVPRARTALYRANAVRMMAD